MELQRSISFERNLALVGRRTTALVDEVVGDDEYVATARTPAQALDVDGVTHLRGGTSVHPGAMVDVRIVDALDYDLVAEVENP
jgi:ribosomal protein S12 methylthiotransferase